MKYIVAGNYTRFAVTLTQKNGELITPYIPTEGDVVQISLYGARRFDYPNYTQASNVLTFEDNGCLQVGLYCLEVKITEANTHKLRCMYREQIRVVASNDDVPTDASFTDDDVQLSGQFDIVASTEIVVDDELSLTSTNPVQNKVVTSALDGKGDNIDIYEDAEDGALVYRVDLRCGNTDLATAIIPYATSLLGGLMSVSDYTKLAGIEVGANKTIVDDALSTTSENPVQNKVVTQKLKTKYDEYEKVIYPDAIDLYFKADGEYVAEWYIESATTAAAGLMSASDKTKLDGIEAQANRIDGISADAASGGYMVYLKNGNTTVASVGIPWAWNSQDGGLMARTDYDRLYNSVGDSLGADYTAGGLDIELKCGNTMLSYASIPFADAQDSGLMTSSDYSKLAGIATGATRVIVDSTFDTTSSNAISNSAVATALGDIESVLDNINGD